MRLLDIVRRDPKPAPWAEGHKIPWDDPGFSARMLREHLSQEHDAASRRAEMIDMHVAWMQSELLGGSPRRILDLGCGPGFYLQRLARLGHTCTGIDFSPGSIAYARERAAAESLPCTYVLADIRKAEFGPHDHYDLVMLIFGEFNVFTREEAASIVSKAQRALVPGGHLLLEPHTFEAVRQLGQAPNSWYAAEAGLFSEEPHIVLYESAWHQEQCAATERHYLVDATSCEVTLYAQTMEAYTEQEYAQLLRESGFDGIRLYPSLTGCAEPSQEALLAVVGNRRS